VTVASEITQAMASRRLIELAVLNVVEIRFGLDIGFSGFLVIL
jgi:hypothetical protein